MTHHAKSVTFKMTTKDGLRERTGKIANLTVGEVRHKFVIHKEGNTIVLSDYRSGHRVTTLNHFKILEMCRKGHNHRITDRQAAEMAVKLMVEQLGAQRCLDVMNAAGQNNP